MGSLSRLRKAYGALKDSTSVTLAKLKSDFKDLDIAIVKATNHVEAPPEERHVRKIFAATEVIKPRADVAYCIYGLSRRLTRTTNWIVAIKVLIVIHRALREGDPTFREELMNYSYKGHILHIANFNDDSSSLASDCSGWVRTYARYIEERLECIRILEYNIEAEPSTKDCANANQLQSRTPLLSIKQLLQQLTALQQLLYRIVCCQVLKESFKIYGAINDGIINLVDTYFEMPKDDAVKALSICKRAGKQEEMLADLYDFCKHLELGKNYQFPTLAQPLRSFLDIMEDYVKEAPETSSILHRHLALPERDGSGHVEEKPEETKEQLFLGEEVSEEKQEDPELLRKSEFRDLISIDDLLGLNDMDPKTEETEESNTLPLSNTSTGNDLQSLNNEFSGPDETGWELALFPEPSNDANIANSGDRLKKLPYDSLYEVSAAQRQMQMQNARYGKRTLMQAPFQQKQDSLAMSNRFSPLTNVQIASLAQQNQQMFQQQQLQQYQFQHLPQNMYWKYHRNSWQYPQPQTPGMYPSNPFEDPVCNYQSNSIQQHGNDSSTLEVYACMILVILLLLPLHEF